MRKERIEAVEKVAEKLFEAEAAIDAAVAAAAILNATMPQARSTAKLSAIVGQDALECALGALSSLVEARNKMVAAHSALDRVRSEIGLGALAFGGGMAKPLKRATLQVVTREAA